jgi:hypothetical protein
VGHSGRVGTETTGLGVLQPPDGEPNQHGPQQRSYYRDEDFEDAAEERPRPLQRDVGDHVAPALPRRGFGQRVLFKVAVNSAPRDARCPWLL